MGVPAAADISSLEEFEGSEELGYGSFSGGHEVTIKKINLEGCWQIHHDNLYVSMNKGPAPVSRYGAENWQHIGHWQHIGATALVRGIQHFSLEQEIAFFLPT